MQDAQVLVASTAVRADNPEIVEARRLGIPVVPRALMLAELMRSQRGIAIAGTHGKTTTTSLVASVLMKGGLDPSFVIGGQLHSAGVGARLGCGAHIVVEADESDASFLHLHPVMAVVTNIDADHMETYGHDPARLRQAFVDFLHRLPFYGRAIVCIDDAGIRAIVPQLHCAVVTYGFSEEARFRAVNVRAVGQQMHFTVQRSGNAMAQPELDVVLNLTGRHNVLNALAAVAVAQELQVADADLLQALAAFGGVGRRFEHYGDLPLAGGGVVTVIDDYGHHPVEIAATLAAARGAYPDRRLVLAFQPHRYSRTRDCFAEFTSVLGQADAVFLGAIYAAGEAPIDGITGRLLADAVRAAGSAPCTYVDHVEDFASCIASQAQGGDVVLCMGAGTIGEVAGQLARSLQKTEHIAQEGQGL